MFKRIAFSLCILTGSQLLHAAGLADRVLILVNDATPPEDGTNGLGASVFLGQYYANARGIPQANILHLNTTVTEGMLYSDYQTQVESPVRAYLAANNNKMLGQILYIVPAYGVPVTFRYSGAPFAMDSIMAAMMMNSTVGYPSYNPYIGETGGRPQRFDAWSDARPVSGKMFIVSRLDGPTAMIAKGLVDKAISAETSLTKQSGTGYFDVQGTRSPNEWQYAVDNEVLAAGTASTAAGFPTVVNNQRITCGAMVHPAATATYYPDQKVVGIWPPGATARISVPLSAFSEGAVTVKLPTGGLAASTPCNTLTFYLTTADPTTWVQLNYPLPPFPQYETTSYMSISKVVGGAVVASNNMLIPADAAILNFASLRFDIRNTGITVMRDNTTLVAMTDGAATPVNYTGFAIDDKGAAMTLNGLTVTNLAGSVLWNDDFSTDSRSRYQWTLPGPQGTGALWAWGWYGLATDSYRFVPGAVGAQLTSYTAVTIRTPNSPDPAALGSARWSGAWVPEMLEEGITATWGAVDEPYANYYPRGGNVFDHIWAGYNFGESFAIAQRALGWKILAVGDPLYAPAIFRPAQPVTVSLTPGPSAGTGGGQPVQLTATVTGGAGNTAVTWSVNPAVGTISTSGLYTPPAAIVSQQTVTITATSAADPTKSASTTMTLSPIVMTVGPVNPSAAAGAAVQFVAQVMNNQNTAVTWSLSPPVGTISATGRYTAPPTIAAAQTVSVKATSAADPTKSVTSTLSLLAPLPVSVSVTPASVTVMTGQTQQFAAAVTGGAGNSQVTWSISSTTGSISTTGLYTAPATVAAMAIVMVKATSVADPAKFSTATVYIRPSLMVSPASATLYGGKSQGFVAILLMGSPAAGIAGPSSIKWSVSPQLGTVSATGVYTAPAVVTATQTVTLTAASAADGAKAASIAITLLPPPVVTVISPSATVKSGTTMQFTFTITGGGANPTVTWSVVSGAGSISKGGLYTGPMPLASPQTVTVKATSTADPAGFGTAAVTLTP